MDTAAALAPAIALPAEAVAQAVLDVRNLVVEFRTASGTVRAVDGVTWSVNAGETLALVGESGCGKSVTALAVLRLLARPAGRVASGQILFEGRDLLELPERDMRTLRGRDIAMVFQEPMTSLNPVMTIGDQITEPLRIHLGMTRQAARTRATELLALVGIPDAARRLDQHPHVFSGGMRQRIMIAMALACDPKLIIADEPTTALDVTVQAQILELLKDLSQRLAITLVLITHNLGIVARYADRVAVMYAGHIVEEGPADRVFAAPRHPYTVGLLRSVPRLDTARTDALDTIEGLPPNLLHPPSGCRFAPRCAARIPACANDPALQTTAPGHQAACHRAMDMPDALPNAPPASAAQPRAAPPPPRETTPLLEVRGLSKHFAIPTGGLFGGSATVHAVEDVSFTIARQETLGLVGESGCGKTTIGRLVLRLTDPTHGAILFEGQNIAAADQAEMRALRMRMQVIFQDPYSSLNPRMSVGDTVMEPLRRRRRMGRAASRDRCAALLHQVGLPADMAARYPHQMSGGQRQRVGIARALAMEPDFIVCDEAVSALDVSVQAQIVNLLARLQAEQGLSYLFIAHDLAVVRHLSHRVIVMYLGRVMEVGPRDPLYAAPLHPYTIALLDAVPSPDPVTERARPRRVLQGELPSPLEPPSGCVFRTRCPRAIAECAAAVPPLREVQPGRFAACIRV